MQAHRDLGVLFVHGIGDQERGQTVGAWGDAVADWLRGWRGDDAVAVDAVHLVADENDPAAPAYVDLTVTLTAVDTGEPKPARWRLAEGWWARSFQPPRFRELAVWAFWILPYAVIAHFVARFERVWAAAGKAPAARAARILAVLLALLQVTAAILLAPLLALLVLVVLVLGAIPIAQLRRGAAALQRALSRSVGDSYILLGSATRAGAIVHRVEHDLRWLAGTCDNLVVVAHSQGAAVAHRAVRSVRPPGLRRFVTVGSGQTKLASLEALRRSGAGLTVWAAPAGALLTVASAAAAVDRLRTGADDPFLPLFGVVYGLVFLVLGAAEARSLRIPDDASLDPGAADGWLDLYASHDPVSNGPVYGVRPGHPVVTSRQVSNLGSTTRDHTTYASNVEQVVATVVDVFAAACGRTVDEFDRLDVATRELAWARRTWRVGWLRRLRVIAAMVGPALVVATADRSSSVGREVLSAAASVLNAVPLVDIDVGMVVPDRLSPGVGALAVLAAVAVAYAGLAGLWRLWDRIDSQRMFARHGYPLWAPEMVTLLWTTAALLVLAPLIAGVVHVNVDTSQVFALESVLIPVGIALVTTLLAMWLRPVVWLLRQLGLVRNGHFPPRAGEIAAVLVPGEVLALGISMTVPGRLAGIVAGLLAIFVVPAVSLLGPAVLSSNATLRRLLRPVRAWAHAGPLPLAAGPLLGPRAGEVRAVYAQLLAARIRSYLENPAEAPSRQGRQERLLDDASVEVVEIAGVMCAGRRAVMRSDAVRAIAGAAQLGTGRPGRLQHDPNDESTSAGSTR